jgi:hypothetical protein
MTELTTPTPTPAPITGAADPTPAPAPAEKTFTQADVDRMISERLGRQKQQYADYDSLKAAQAELDQLKAGQLSEQEKLQKQIEKLTQKAAEAEAKALEKERLAQTTLIRSAVVSEAARLGFANPEDAYKLLDAPPAIGEDGKPAGVAEAVAALAQSRPYLLKQGNQLPNRIPAQEPFNPAGPPGQQRETDEQKRKRLFNRGAQIFDTADAERRGGGVIWNKKPE